MKMTRLFTGADGQSHFEDLPIELLDNPFGQSSQPLAVHSVVFGEVSIKEVMWHNPPFPQYIVMLAGAMEIEVGDGSTKTFREGDILLAEDTTGKGHITRAASEGPRRYMVLLPSP